MDRVRILLPQVLSYITYIFNTVQITSKFPMTWKISKIVPIAKKSEPVALSDYRPISILPALSDKSVVISRITDYCFGYSLVEPQYLLGAAEDYK
jgi:hypothetical protein